MQLELKVVEVPGRPRPVLNNISMEFEKGDTWKLHKNQMFFFHHLDWWMDFFVEQMLLGEWFLHPFSYGIMVQWENGGMFER